MNEYKIVTDSGCDILPDVLKEWGVPFENLNVKFESDTAESTNDALDPKVFYDRMRAGEIAKTSAINVEQFSMLFKKELDAGYDILYLGFSSGISNTFNAARIAAEQIREEYPERKIIVVDSLCASAGQGLLLYLGLQKQKEGFSIEENAEYLENNKLNLVHWFTVDDLVYLKRGGRISPTLAFVGGALGIKPVMHVDNDGHLVNVSKVRGRKAAIKALADKYNDTALDHKNGTVFISHGDCIDDANLLADMIKAKAGHAVDIITYVGPVIGAHSGPGTLALFFVGKER
ncbi:MAG: DegV family protein [Clostridia bacterium]|nr:DegV family protein [Clostridia bacterium]MBQ4574160.1 DegV family protein [Clostridia bacterium]